MTRSIVERPLGRLTAFAAEDHDYTIRAAQFRPDVRELLTLNHGPNVSISGALYDEIAALVSPDTPER